MLEPIKILHVFSQLGRGGAEIRMLEILRNVDRRLHRFHFCSLSGLPGKLDDEFRSLGAEVHLLRRGEIGFSWRFRQLLHRHRIDVVHTHVLNYAGVVLRLAVQSGVPVRVAQFRSSHDGRPDTPTRTAYRNLMRRWIGRYATYIEAVSEGAMESIWGSRWRADPRCRVIYDGLDPAPFSGPRECQAVRREFNVPETAPLFIHVGRMAPPKNHVRLVDIFAVMTGRQPEARLLLVGRGGNEIERAVRRRMAEHNVTDRVIIAGERNDVPRLMKAADGLIFPSLWEGLPGAVLEACAAGTPVLASDLPGVREIAARMPGVRCLPLQADDDRWAEELEQIVRDDGASSGREATRRAFAESVFTIRRCVDAHCRLWQGRESTETLRRAA